MTSTCTGACHEVREYLVVLSVLAVIYNSGWILQRRNQKNKNSNKWNKFSFTRTEDCKVSVDYKQLKILTNSALAAYHWNTDQQGSHPHVWKCVFVWVKVAWQQNDWNYLDCKVVESPGQPSIFATWYMNLTMHQVFSPGGRKPSLDRYVHVAQDPSEDNECPHWSVSTPHSQSQHL